SVRAAHAAQRSKRVEPPAYSAAPRARLGLRAVCDWGAAPVRKRLTSASRFRHLDAAGDLFHLAQQSVAVAPFDPGRQRRAAGALPQHVIREQNTLLVRLDLQGEMLQAGGELPRPA